MERRFTANHSVVGAELGSETVLLNVETGIYYGLDEVGTRIWHLLSAGATEEQICAKLCAEYGIEATRLRSDVSEFLDELASKGIARIAAAS